MKLGEFVYRLAFHTTFVAVVGLRVNSLEGGHTHTFTLQTKAISRNMQACTGLSQHALSLKSSLMV